MSKNPKLDAFPAISIALRSLSHYFTKFLHKGPSALMVLMYEVDEIDQ